MEEGELGEAKVSEFFGVETMREKEHETMPGVRVGERWAPGIALVMDLVEMFQRIGNGVQANCVGEEVEELLSALSVKWPMALHLHELSVKRCVDPSFQPASLSDTSGRRTGPLARRG